MNDLRYYKFDLVILDTCHTLPGEVLDFLAIFPFINPNGIIIVHDTICSHLKVKKQFRIADISLFSAVVADKWLPLSPDPTKVNNEIIAANIGIFRLNSETKKYLNNIFYLLFIPWTYFLSEFDIECYFDLLSKYYSAELLSIFVAAIKLNKLYIDNIKI